MNTLKIKLIAIALIFGGMFFTNQALATTNPDSVTGNSENSLLDEEVDEIIEALETDHELWTEDIITYEVYSNNDELLFTKQSERTTPLNDVEFLTVLEKSDFLMEYNNIRVYRMD